MPWYIENIRDNGKGNFYRYRVEGTNTEGRAPASFYWNVPDIKSDTFQPHPSASPEVFEAIRQAKGTPEAFCRSCVESIALEGYDYCAACLSHMEGAE